jgi:hypothetical protein
MSDVNWINSAHLVSGVSLLGRCLNHFTDERNQGIILKATEVMICMETTRNPTDSSMLAGHPCVQATQLLKMKLCSSF